MIALQIIGVALAIAIPAVAVAVAWGRFAEATATNRREMDALTHRFEREMDVLSHKFEPVVKAITELQMQGSYNDRTLKKVHERLDDEHNRLGRLDRNVARVEERETTGSFRIQREGSPIPKTRAVDDDEEQP